jgi:uracil-DNA glycosylase
MIIGQDWGPVDLFIHQNGLDKHAYTNRELIELLAHAGIPVDPAPVVRSNSGVFATDAVLCLKRDGPKAKVSPACFDNCGPQFLPPQIQLVRPKVVVAMGKAAHDATMRAFGLEPANFRTAVDSPQAVELMPGTCLIPVYLCTRLIMKTHRSEEQQADGLRITTALKP